MTRMFADYEKACALHAHAQGLTPPSLILKQAGFKPQILQTGGFCMVLEAYKDTSVQVWVTQDSAGEEPYGDDPGSQPTYLVCAYSATQEDEEELACQYEVRLEDLPTQVLTYSLEVFNQS